MIKGDGKMRNTDMLDTQNILRFIESIPSPKTEPFKIMKYTKVGLEWKHQNIKNQQFKKIMH